MLTPRIANDLARADAVIATHHVRTPTDPVGQFTLPRNQDDRQPWVDFVFDMADPWAARALADAPRRHTVTWAPPNGTN